MRSAVLVAAGAFSWTLVEYVLHRFAFHRAGSSSTFLRKYLKIGVHHLSHHAKLDDKRLAFAPPIAMLVSAVLDFTGAILVFGLRDGFAFAMGFLAGYIAYEYVHYSVHFRAPRTRLGRALRAYHLAHHHATPRARFGVTSPFWDVVLGTYPRAPS